MRIIPTKARNRTPSVTWVGAPLLELKFHRFLAFTKMVIEVRRVKEPL
jgi:hypothetical protein